MIKIEEIVKMPNIRQSYSGQQPQQGNDGNEIYKY